MHIVIVDDEAAVRDSLSRTLRFEGYDVSVAADGAEALAVIRAERPDGVILDMMMPVLDGLTSCRELRAEGNYVPVLMLTARGAVDDRVAGLEAGADDYLVKPFALQELLARVRALLRRAGHGREPASTTGLRFGDLVLDPGTREVHRGTRPLRLTRTEFTILETFLRHPRMVLTRAVMFDQVWGYDAGGASNGLDVYVGYLRRKLEEAGSHGSCTPSVASGTCCGRSPCDAGVSLRTRLTVLAVGAVAVAVIGVALTSFLVVRGKLYQQFDDQVRSYAQLASHTDSPQEALAALRTDSGTHRTDLDVQFLGPSGPTGDIPVTAKAADVATGRSGSVAETLVIGHDRYRVWTVARPDGGAAQVAQNAEGIEHTLGELGLLHVLVGLVGVALAAFVGRRLAVAGLRPVDKLTSAVERVAVTQDLSEKIDVPGRGEVARLAEAFNTTLAALAESRAAQRRLVQDAGHELRTPLTSLRNNVELLVHAKGGLPSQDHDRLLADLSTQAAELSTLVEELVELGRDDGDPVPREPVNLADVVAAAVTRAGPRAADVRIEVAAEPVIVLGEPTSLERAVLNLVDNAVKWSPPGGVVQVDVTVSGDEARIAVTDQGPGIRDSDLPHVFERFYRADTARALPGSGLGLAIVERIAVQHGGTAHAGRAGTGGAVVAVALPVTVS
ncbi:hypothetical protein GCM10029964_085600 [Kibdelosporangium lantanae]